MADPRVGIVGAGQLGRMMALAAYPLGIECRFLDTRKDSPGGQVGFIHTAELDDISSLRTLAGEVDVVTFDIENVSTDALRDLETITAVRPGPDAVGTTQDRLDEKQLFSELGIPTGPYRAVHSTEELAQVAADLGLPLVLKARRLGYDGRGQRIVTRHDEIKTAWTDLGGVPCIAEAFVHFDRELSIIGVRGLDGEIRSYPLSENAHEDGILKSTIAPYDDTALHADAHQFLTRVLSHFNYVGVLTIEFFSTPDGLLANEIAPRVHNSGHWTIEGAETSQFENHIRAIVGLPLGSTQPRGHSAMINLLGTIPERSQLLAVPGLKLHDYGKSPRPGRKLGHCTLNDDNRDRLKARLNQTLRSLATAQLRP